VSIGFALNFIKGGKVNEQEKDFSYSSCGLFEFTHGSGGGVQQQ
jgi:hypothetical protein